MSSPNMHSKILELVVYLTLTLPCIKYYQPIYQLLERSNQRQSSQTVKFFLQTVNVKLFAIQLTSQEWIAAYYWIWCLGFLVLWKSKTIPITRAYTMLTTAAEIVIIHPSRVRRRTVVLAAIMPAKHVMWQARNVSNTRWSARNVRHACNAMSSNSSCWSWIHRRQYVFLLCTITLGNIW